MLDDTWVCNNCQKSLNEGTMPRLCAKNGLRATWCDLPPRLLELSLEELDAIALSKIFMVIHDLRTANDQSRSQKTLLLPLSNPINVEGRQHEAESLELDVQRLHKRRSGVQLLLRPDIILEADEYLQRKESSRDAGRRDVLRRWCQKELAKAEETTEQEVDEGEREKSTSGPMKSLLFATVLPTMDDLRYFHQILNIGPLDVRTRHLYDPCGEGGVNVQRKESLTSKQWLVHRLRSVFRDGLPNDAGLIMAMFIRQETSRLIQLTKLGDDKLTAVLMSVPGTEEFFRRKAQDLRAIENNFGPPTFSFSTTTPFNGVHHLACFVSQKRHSKEYNTLQVWEHKDEVQRLTLRPGHSIAEGESGYFVHQRTEVRSDNCKFHRYCKRTPLDDWSHR